MRRGDTVRRIGMARKGTVRLVSGSHVHVTWLTETRTDYARKAARRKREVINIFTREELEVLC
jgi:hypothetical protein